MRRQALYALIAAAVLVGLVAGLRPADGDARRSLKRARVEMYTQDSCTFCHQARVFLDAKGIAFQEYNCSGAEGHQQELRRRAGGRVGTPQIFIHGIHVGSLEGLMLLEKLGKLEDLLGLVS